ncbi:hypothetical protein AHF37_10278 [Paragonimus kellicotti]|nr:hypothetical protein AHF37_10278 [Paragonimus kellicotti]
MNTLPSIRSVNTFQNTDVRRSSVSNLRYPRATSLYLPANEQDEESHTQLLPNTPYTGERRAQTLGRPHQLTTGSRNLTNPLFDSVGSLDQTPWYRSYGQPVRTSPPRINLPLRPCDSSGFATARDIQSTIRIPVPRSPGRTSAYSAAGSRRFPESSVRGSYERRAPRQSRRCAGSLGCLCCKPENNPYSLPDETVHSVEWTKPKSDQPPKPWIVCLLTVSTIFDLLLMILITLVVFFLK